MTLLHLGIDLGGSKIHAVVCDHEGRIRGRARRITPASKNYAAVVDALVESIVMAATQAGTEVLALGSIGLAVPGPVDPIEGTLLTAPNLGWKDKHLLADLSTRLSRCVEIGNDANLGALAELRFGAARSNRSVFCAFVGTGLGGAVIVDGRLVVGRHGYAGEIGHLRAPFGDARCACGRLGCLETTASRTGIMRMIGESVASGLSVDLPNQARIGSSELFAAWNRGCPVLRSAITRSAEALAWGLTTGMSVIDPETVIIGGGVAQAFGSSYLELVRHELNVQGFVQQRYTSDLRLAILGDDAVALGACCLGMEASIGDVSAVGGS